MLKSTIVLCLALICVHGEEDCLTIGGFQGDLFSQPNGCQYCQDQKCNKLTGHIMESPDLDTRSWGGNCPQSQKSVMQPLLAIEYVPLAYRTNLTGKVFKVEQSQKLTQMVRQEVCDFNWCYNNRRSFVCDQGHNHKYLWVKFPNGTLHHQRLHYYEKCTCKFIIRNVKSRNQSKKMKNNKIQQGDSNVRRPNCWALGLEKAIQCKIPFRYHGIKYNGCINHDDENYWCPTELDSNLNYIPSKFGYCSVQCPVVVPSCKTIDGPQTKSVCKFPFVYRELTFHNCTSTDSTLPWCATETDRHGFYIPGKWGYCKCQS